MLDNRNKSHQSIYNKTASKEKGKSCSAVEYDSITSDNLQ